MKNKNNKLKPFHLLFIFVFIFMGYTIKTEKVFASDIQLYGTMSGDVFILGTHDVLNSPFNARGTFLQKTTLDLTALDGGWNCTTCTDTDPIGYYYNYPSGINALITNNGLSGDGTYYWLIRIADGTVDNKYYVVFYKTGSTITTDPPPETETKITTVSPYNGEIISTTSTATLGFTGNIKYDDFTGKDKVHFKVESQSLKFRNCADVFCSQLDAGFSFDIRPLIAEFGEFSYSTTTENPLPEGKYLVSTTIETGKWCLLGYCLSSDIKYSTSTSFIVGTTTKADMIIQTNQEFFDGLSVSATTTSAIKEACNILVSFDFYDCFKNLMILGFVPDDRAIGYYTNTLKTGVITHFPFGYITDFVDIISTSTVGSLTVIDATVPNALPFGQNQHIRLDLTNVLDPYLNATTGAFTNESASSTKTLLEITMEYWKKILYVLAVFYIMGRILGSSLVPTFNHFGSKGSLSDTNKGDDSYRLKEWLYKHKK